MRRRSYRRSKKRSKLNKINVKRSRVKNHIGFEIYIKKILKQVHGNINISSDSLSQLNALLNQLLLKLTQTSDMLRISNDNKTLTARDVMNANRIILPGELAKHGVSELTKSVTKYTSNIDRKKKSEKRTKASISGLVISPTRVGNFMRKNMKGRDARLSETAPIAMAAVIEYITAEILEFSGNCTRDYRRVIITPRCLFLSVKNDNELNEMLNNIKFKFMRGGVIPNIHMELLPKKRKSKKRKSKKRSRQNFGRFRLRNHHLERRADLGPWRIHKSIKPEKVHGKVVFRSFGARRKKNTKIPNAAILRLIKRAGGIRVSKPVYEESRYIINKFLESIIRRALMNTMHNRRITINSNDVWNALEYKMYSNVVKFGKYKPGTRALMDVRRLQKTTNLLIPKATFRNLVEEIGKEYKTNIRFTAKAINILQNSVESYMIDLYKKAIKAMIRSDRTTLNTKDIKFVYDNLV